MKTLFKSYYNLFIGGYHISEDYTQSSWTDGIVSAGFVADYQTGTVGFNQTAPESNIYLVSSHIFFILLQQWYLNS